MNREGRFEHFRQMFRAVFLVCIIVTLLGVNGERSDASGVAAGTEHKLVLMAQQGPPCPVGDASNPPQGASCFAYKGSSDGCDYWWDGYKDIFVKCDPDRWRPEPCPIGDTTNATTSGQIHCYYITETQSWDGCLYWWNGFNEVKVNCDNVPTDRQPCPIGDTTNAVNGQQCYQYVGNDGCTYWWDGMQGILLTCSSSTGAVPCPVGDASNAASGGIQCYYAVGTDNCTYWFDGFKTKFVTCAGSPPPDAKPAPPQVVRNPYWSNGCLWVWTGAAYESTQCERIEAPIVVSGTFAGATSSGDQTSGSEPITALPPPVIPSEEVVPYSAEATRNQIWIVIFNLTPITDEEDGS